MWSGAKVSAAPPEIPRAGGAYFRWRSGDTAQTPPKLPGICRKPRTPLLASNFGSSIPFPLHQRTAYPFYIGFFELTQCSRDYYFAYYYATAVVQLCNHYAIASTSIRDAELRKINEKAVLGRAPHLVKKKSLCESPSGTGASRISKNRRRTLTKVPKIYILDLSMYHDPATESW